MSNWLRLNRTSGSGDGNIIVTASSYSGDTARSTRVKVYNEQYGLTAYTEVVQHEYVEPTGITADPTFFNFNPSGEILQLHINASAPWYFADPWASWVGVGGGYTTGGTAGQHTIPLITTKNMTGEVLDDIISIKCGDEIIYLRVRQEEYVPEPDKNWVRIFPTTLDVPQEGGEYTIDVTSNGDWVVNAPDWIELSTIGGTGDGTVTVRIPENMSYYDLIGDIIFSTVDESKTVNVIQDGVPLPTISVNPTTMFVKADSGSYTIRVSASDEWEIASCPNWISYTIDGDTVTITTTDNGYTRRSGDIVFKIKGMDISAKTEVTQRKNIYLEVDPTDIELPYSSGHSATITIRTNSDWDIYDDLLSGYEFTKTSGSGNDTIIITSTSKDTGEDTFHISAGDEDGYKHVDISITRLAPYLRITPNPIYFPATGGTTEITIESENGYWSFDKTTLPKGWEIEPESARTTTEPIVSTVTITSDGLYTETDNAILSFTNGYSNADLVVNEKTLAYDSDLYIICKYRCDEDGYYKVLSETTWVKNESPEYATRCMFVDGVYTPVSNRLYLTAGEHTIEFITKQKEYGAATHFGQGITNMYSVEFKNKNTTIAYNAFQDCIGLEEIIIGSGIHEVFEDSSGGFTRPFSTENRYALKRIIVNPANQTYDSRENCGCLIRTAENRLILGGSEGFIPNTIEIIGFPNGQTDLAFSFTTLDTLTIPSSVRVIGSRAFHSSTIRRVYFEGDDTTFGTYAFWSCPYLHYVVLPKNMTELAEYTFSDSGLIGLAWGEDFQYCRYRSLMNCHDLSIVYGEQLMLKSNIIPGLERTGSPRYYNFGIKEDSEWVWNWQAGGSTNLYPYNHNNIIDAIEGEEEIWLYSNTPWTATTSTAGVTISPSTGDSGYTIIDVAIPENTGGERSICIDFSNTNGDVRSACFLQNKAPYKVLYATTDGNLLNTDYENTATYFNGTYTKELEPTSNTYGVITYDEYFDTFQIGGSNFKDIVFPEIVKSIRSNYYRPTPTTVGEITILRTTDDIDIYFSRTIISTLRFKSVNPPKSIGGIGNGSTVYCPIGSKAAYEAKFGSGCTVIEE